MTMAAESKSQIDENKGERYRLCEREGRTGEAREGRRKNTEEQEREEHLI